MVAINATNVINVLVMTFYVATIILIPMKQHEMELYDTVTKLTRSTIKIDFIVEHDRGFDFEELVGVI